MTTKMNLNGTTRKALVAAIAEITGDQPIYRKVPTCNYDIGDITVTKDGSIICPDDFDILTALAYAGFTAENDDAAEQNENTGLTVSLPPLKGYMGTTLKDGAQTLLETGRGDPLMARWQVEGGTVSVFTSDLTGSWTEAWRDNGQARSWLRQIFHPRGSDGPAQAADPAAPAVSAFWTKIDLLLAVSIAILALFLAELVIRRWQPRRARK